MNLRAKDKKQKRRVSLEERRENVMAAVRKFVARKFHVVVYQNNGKEMYKRVYCTCKVFYIFY